MPPNDPDDMLLHYKNLQKEDSTTTTSSSTKTVGLDESDRTKRGASGTNLLLSDESSPREQQSRCAGAEERYEESCQLLHTRLSCLSAWRSGQTLRIHDTGKCTFTTGKSGPDIEISIRDDNNGIVISSTVFGTNHVGANDDIISFAWRGGEKNKRTSMPKISYSLMTKMMQYNTMLNQSSRGGQVVLYDGRFVFYLHASLSILEKSRYMDLVDVLDEFHVKAIEISKDFESAAVKAQRRQLHLLRFR